MVREEDDMYSPRRPSRLHLGLEPLVLPLVQLWCLQDQWIRHRTVKSRLEAIKWGKEGIMCRVWRILSAYRQPESESARHIL